MTRSDIMAQFKIGREIFEAMPKAMQELLIYEMEAARRQYTEEPAHDH